MEQKAVDLRKTCTQQDPQVSTSSVTWNFFFVAIGQYVYPLDGVGKASTGLRSYSTSTP